MESSVGAGTRQKNFDNGELPSVVVTSGWWQLSDVVLEVVKLPNRTVVSRQTYSAPEFNDFSLDSPVRSSEVRRTALPRLLAGKYTAELWYQGERVDSADFSVSGASAGTGHEVVRTLADAVGAPPGAGGGMNIRGEMARLDSLVHLSGEQRAAVAKIFTEETGALQTFVSIEDRMVKGAEIRQRARAQVREILTTEQRHLYDRTPQRLGGGSMQDPVARATRLNESLTLTADQMTTVTALFQSEANSLQELSPEERTGPVGIAIRQATKAQVRALLTAEQQANYDANPNPR